MYRNISNSTCAFIGQGQEIRDREAHREVLSAKEKDFYFLRSEERIDNSNKNSQNREGES